MRLPDAWVIFILSYDPFGEGRMLYTIKNRCIDLPGLDYDDGAATLLLYVGGRPDDVPESLSSLFHSSLL